MTKKNITDYSLKELQLTLDKLSLPKYSAKQIMEWVYKHKIDRLSEITNISKKNIKIIEDNFDLYKTAYSDVQISKDGTKKYIFPSQYGNIESVIIPDQDRVTICVSSQVGCKMNCEFCMTGKSGFKGNISAGEIINQIISVKESSEITNIVFMGMGEPLDNKKEVFKAIEILTSDWGFAMSPKRITLSTSGVLKEIIPFLEETKIHLAISLHNPFSSERAEIMPIEKSNHIEKIIKILRSYDFSHQRRLSFEYIIFEGINDSINHAQAIVNLIKGLHCRVNLIKFHKVEGINLKSPSDKNMLLFRDFLNNNGVIATIRRSRGEDINAACGQLKHKKYL